MRIRRKPVNLILVGLHSQPASVSTASLTYKEPFRILLSRKEKGCDASSRNGKTQTSASKIKQNMVTLRITYKYGQCDHVACALLFRGFRKLVGVNNPCHSSLFLTKYFLCLFYLFVYIYIFFLLGRCYSFPISGGE